MNVRNSPNRELAKRAIERFWETYPPVWHHVRAYIDSSASDNKLTMGGFGIMRSIRHGKDTVSSIAENRHLSRPTISRAVDSLVGKGLVTRTHDSQDRRLVKLALTEEGEQLLASMREETRNWMLSKFEALDEQELDTIIRAFDLLKMTFIK